MQLKSIQDSFIDAILNDNKDILAAEIKASSISNIDKIEIYKHNVLSKLRDTLKNRYPIILVLTGEDFFKYATNKFIKKHYPLEGNLDEYGRDFITFIENLEEAKDFPFLSDVAKFEWATHIAYFAEDSDKININTLTKISAKELQDMKFKLHPSISIISSKYDIIKIIDIANGAGSENDNINQQTEILIIRPEYKIYTIRLIIGEYQFLSELKNGKSILQAYESACKINKDFDLANSIEKFSTNGTFISFYKN